MLKELTQINGVSGDEKKVREYIINKISHLCDEITVDPMGSIIAFKKGTGNTKHKIMICAHMDEVGFIVSGITKEGFVKFKSVGGFDDRILLTQRVIIETESEQVSGVMGIKAVHLQRPEERKKVVNLDDMYIDIGAKDDEDALKYIAKGDYIAFDSAYRLMGNGCVKAKALDDRAGCYNLIRLMQNEFESDLYFCFTTQEEVGLRGATVVANRVGVDIAFILEATTAGDTPFTDEYMYCTRLGKGPVISIMDRGSYSDKKLNRFVADVAEKNDIQIQYKQTTNGGNDAGAIQTSLSGVKTCALSVPCRYIHSPVSMAKLCDIDSVYELMKRTLADINMF